MRFLNGIDFFSQVIPRGGTDIIALEPSLFSNTLTEYYLRRAFVDKGQASGSLHPN